MFYKKINKSKTGVSLLKGVNFRFIYTGFSLWMNGYRQKQLYSMLLTNYSSKKFTVIISQYFTTSSYDLAGIYLLKVNNRNTRTRCEIYSKLTIKTPEQSHWRHSGVFIVKIENISHC